MPRRVKETVEFDDLHETHESESVSDMEFEELLFEGTSSKPSRGGRYLLVAGFGLLSAAVIYILQQTGILPGAGLQDIFLLFPLVGIILVLMVGLSRKKHKRHRRSRHGSRKAHRAALKNRKHENPPGKLGVHKKVTLKLPAKSRKKYLAGVCGGIAQRIGMDPTVFRALFMIALIATGGTVPLILYIIFAIFMPSPDGKSKKSLQ